MNGNFYQNPTFPTNELPITEQMPNNSISPKPAENLTNYSVMTIEQNNIENLLKLNKGKRVNIYASYPNSTEWQNKVYTGILEQTGIDYLIINDPTNSHWFLIKMNYLDYIEFMENINYS